MRKIWGTSLLILAVVAFIGTMTSGCASPTSTQEAPQVSLPVSLEGRMPTVLVCPVNSLTSDADAARLSLILAPLIRRDLFCVQRLSVVPTGDTHVSGKSFFLTQRGLRKLGRAHDADIVTVGILRGDSRKISIDLSVYDLKNNYILLKTTVEGKTSHIFSLQRRLTYELIDALEIKLNKEERRRLTSSSPKKFAAADEYSQGLKSAFKESYTEALISYTKAVEADKAFALPYISEARIYRQYNAPLKAMESYEKAVVRDESFAEAWYRLNLYASQYAQKDSLAAEYCRMALAIAPRFGKARLSLGARLYTLGQLDAAIEETRKAADLLPTDPLPRYNLGVYYRDAGEPAQARLWFQAALRTDPKFERARVELQNLKGK